MAADETDAYVRIFQDNPGAERPGDNLEGLTGEGREYLKRRAQAQPGYHDPNNKPLRLLDQLEKRIVCVKGVDQHAAPQDLFELLSTAGNVTALSWFRGRTRHPVTLSYRYVSRNVAYAEYAKARMLTDKDECSDTWALGLHGTRFRNRLIEVYRCNKDWDDIWAAKPK